MYGLYRLTTKLGAPLIRNKLRSRAANGKEDPARLDERLGHASSPRPDGRLVWIHAARVGETVSVLPLINALIEDPNLTVLITSGTVTSATVIEPHLSERVIHHYVPVDLVEAVQRFLDHWRPDLAILVESELWPNLVFETLERDVPMVMVQGRLSDKSCGVGDAGTAPYPACSRAFELSSPRPRPTPTDSARSGRRPWWSPERSNMSPRR